ncbi:hypothetical protein QP868_11870, partial [Brevibacterium sp. UMB1308A]|uniref:hypothetical protein n=1 Tax=Brevibacterium sp. UMB1308A TaxID=3050608 RepID=UPI0025508B29
VLEPEQCPLLCSRVAMLPRCVRSPRSPLPRRGRRKFRSHDPSRRPQYGAVTSSLGTTSGN